ncbi:Holliday junction resolvase RuvX [Chloroflexota bacterium]
MSLSDSEGILASPLTIIERGDSRQAVDTIINIINQHQVEQIVIGIPYSMDGSTGKQAEKVKAFTQELIKHVKISIEFRDERLTTVLAKRLMQTTRTKKTKKKVRDDAVAAALILQGYLDEIHNS